MNTQLPFCTALTIYLSPRRFLFLALCLVILSFSVPGTQAAVTEAWVQRYSNVVSNTHDQAVKIVRDATGDRCR